MEGIPPGERITDEIQDYRRMLVKLLSVDDAVRSTTDRACYLAPEHREEIQDVLTRWTPARRLLTRGGRRAQDGEDDGQRLRCAAVGRRPGK